MKYATLNTDGSSVDQVGLIRELFPSTCFSKSGPSSDFITEHQLKEVVEQLPYTKPNEKLTKITPEYNSSDQKVYTVKKEATTQSEKDLLIQEKWEEVREERNLRLSECDWRFLSDRVTASSAWSNYRTELRDLPSTQSDDPYSINWPTPPN